MLEYFSPEFDAGYYRTKNADLKNLSELDLKMHWDNHGRAEGRCASPLASRASFTTAIRRAHRALEIGPFNKPVLAGPQAKFFDVLDQERLKERAASINEDGSRIPFIDYVSPTADLKIVDDIFELVVSSHSIEHQPDLVRHLRDIEALLLPGGIYAMFIPDCRYCFDHYIEPSNLNEIIDAHFEGRRLHRLAKVIEHRAFTVHNDAVRHWQGDHGSPTIDIDKVRGAINEWTAHSGTYIDVHAWQFTPDTFRDVITNLNTLGLISLSPIRIYDTPRHSNEFFAVLVK